MILDLPVLALTPGEPAGVGPECVARFADQHPAHRLVVVADSSMMNETAESLGLAVRFGQWSPGQGVRTERPVCLQVDLPRDAVAGQPDPANAAYVLECIRQAVQLVQDGQAGAVVTGPIHKGMINDAGIPFSGHTEFLAELAGVQRVVMMLATQDMRVALVTTHLPLSRVPAAITTDTVFQTIRITWHELRTRFGLGRPRLQVLGLNPHAGEGGHLGHEDDVEIAPAIAQAREAGMQAWGPVPADTAFTPTALAECDAVIAMYHDQGLPVLKHAGFGDSVNITLGLPFVRTSVDHGTALDIAGKGIADIDSLAAAVRMAESMCRDSLGPH